MLFLMRLLHKAGCRIGNLFGDNELKKVNLNILDNKK